MSEVRDRAEDCSSLLTESEYEAVSESAGDCSLVLAAAGKSILGWLVAWNRYQVGWFM
jgi:hypothetical protein